MKKIINNSVILLLLFVTKEGQAQKIHKAYDVVIYGATSAGVMAAVAAKQNGTSVMLLSPETHIGGLTSNGLGWTDIGNQTHQKTIGGLTLNFFHRIHRYYQNAKAWNQETLANYREKVTNSIYELTDSLMWTFEPHVAEKVFNNFIRENKITMKLNQWLDRQHGVKKENGKIVSITMLNGDTYSGKVFIDATYEGDLMAAAGVSYTIGREPNSKYGETINGIETQLTKGNNLPRGIDPYLQKGNATSGLLPGINADAGGKDGEGDKKIQAYCYRVCLTDATLNRVMVAKPANYKKEDFELIIRAAQKGVKTFWKLSPLPNRKTDSNNDGGVSMDYIGMNYDYPEASYLERKKMDEAHLYWTKGLIWTVQHDPGIPADVQKKYASWGLAKDEFKENEHMPYKLYVREARRMVSDFVMSESYLKGDKTVPESIAMGNYNMDSHNVQRHVTAEGDVQNEGDVQIAVEQPYPISYKAIIPNVKECTNLLVPVCLSASHIAYGSIRMEPVFMMLGQSSGIAASIAVKNRKDVEDINYTELEKKLLSSGQILSHSQK
ncbi:FAD-dependent oxidoreductase [Ginsengibacter hankyongi]|uniref:FAD-dependent oxidoreductase n=1 Tax=Ginsengibacter hankyongi TaxID=2607284 RepID=A0A5J5IE10_9BACT|nr:FAD-dependent oxidoreductase [Ginsengibacter hankyongi]KAA9036562.1 FAD-dependent oxidoreductase [Ginsengibacter hankyongi]